MRVQGKGRSRRRALAAALVVGVVAGALAGGALPDTASGQAAGVTPNSAYVQTVFRTLLGRTVDSGGLAYWTGVLDSGVPRSTVSWALVNSTEYRASVISGMYRTFLNRATDTAGLNYWIAQIANGMTFEAFQSTLVGSDEYFVMAAKGKGNNTDFVKSMYKDVLGRAVETAGLNYFVSLLNVGTPRPQVVGAIVYSTEHLSATVNGYYQKFLARSVDVGGSSYWVGQLQAGARDELIIALIIGSDEYFADATVGATPPPTSTPPTTAPPNDPRAATGAWTAPVNYGNAAGIMQHAVLIPNTSKVLFFEDGAGTYVLDTNTGAIAAEVAGNNLFCAGQTVLADGRIMTIGGDENGQPEIGLVNTNTFNAATNTWTKTAPMNFLRWYPTATKLPDGRILATSGTASGVLQTTPEVYNPGSNTWTSLPSANNFIPSYPFMFVLPDGRIVNVGSFTSPTNIQVLNPANWTWSTVDPAVTDVGSAVMYQPGKILRAGSSGFPGTASQTSSAKAYVVDMTAPNPHVRQIASMRNPRAFLQMTVLPDGNVLVTGGNRNHDITPSANATLQAEQWSPVTEQWTTLASNYVGRYYHSTAMLLPDGRVLLGGGWGGGDGVVTRQHNYEIFSPPYLFKGARPTITSAPGAAGYGTSFSVGTPDSIARAVLMAPAAVTHNFDENGRSVPLNFTPIAGGVQVSAPANANLAPPGPYMLFLLNGNGVPSVARWITIG